MQSEPLVSCIMPTRARAGFAAAAVECWLRQTYPNRELVIVDDADAPSLPDGIGTEHVEYYRLLRRLSVGAKRNVACSRAAGGILCHWDDDDYSAPERIADQVKRLMESGCQLTGYSAMRFRSAEGREWHYRSSYPDYCLGTSLMYTRTFWERHAFRDLNVNEDGQMWTAARREHTVVACDAGDLMVATIHAGNTSPRQLNSKRYEEITACA